MDRRQFMTALSLGAVAVASAGCASATGQSAPSSAAPSQPTPAAAPILLSPDVATRSPLPATPITALGGRGHHLALTVDDGASAEVVGAYLQWAKDTGARFTFFVTASYPGWLAHRATLRPLVESGQIQLGNHTWSHPALTSLTAAGVADELNRTKSFLRNHFGVDGTPYFRPPYGYHNSTVDKVAADCGYTMPTLWYGSLSDSGLITEKYLLQCARKYFRPQAVVIGHANHLPVTHVYPQLTEIIRSRGLRLVTLTDYFA